MRSPFSIKLCFFQIILIILFLNNLNCENYNFIDESTLDQAINTNNNKELRLNDFTPEELNLISYFTRPKPELNITYAEKIYQAGFEFEEHKILTEDGYILTVWRIPRKIGESYDTERSPVVLQHGLLDDSWTWFALNTSKCLPINLAQENFDVWLPNSRGNMFSNEHIDPEYDSSKLKSKFWNFTWHEMAKYDLPAISEYIKKVTKFEKIKWVGHSQGTMQFFLSHAISPNYMESTFEKFAAIGTVVTVFNSV
jgi:pimeloyl-ACP methyl ester carboxylesterase